MPKKPTWEAKSAPNPDGVRQTYRLTSLAALRAVLEAHGFTSGYQLAKAAGLTPGTVNHLVHGHRQTASPRTVGKLREVLGVDARDLFVLDESQVHENARREGRAA
jgi:transcriptional regulator with XRE-family HTH domain